MKKSYLYYYLLWTLWIKLDSTTTIIFHSDDDDLRIHLDSVTGSVTNPKLPEDEAPPPYTPPRLLTDSHKSNNMQCIAEGLSEEDECATSHDENVGGESALQTDNVISVLPAKPVRTIEQSPYDTHMAFMRSPPTHSSTLGGREYDSHAAFTRPQVDEKSPSKIEQDIPPHALKPSSQIGRASCRERV